jgi:hypothetical protein
MSIDTTTVKQEMRDAIIKEHMFKYYHWTVGILCFTIGMLLGILVS